MVQVQNPADLEEAFLLSETDFLLNQDSTDIESVVELVKSLLALGYAITQRRSFALNLHYIVIMFSSVEICADIDISPRYEVLTSQPHLSAFKIMEQTLLEHLSKHMEDREMIRHSQHGFNKVIVPD